MSNLEKDNLVLGEIISDDLAPKVLISLPKYKNIHLDLQSVLATWAEVIFEGDQVGLKHSRHFPKVATGSFQPE